MTPIFDRAAVNRVRDPMRRLFRLILYRKKITTDDFVRMHSQHAKRLGQSTKTINSDRQNYRKAVNSEGEMTFNRFQFFLTEIFRFNIIRFSITVGNEDGTETTYSSDEIA